MTILSAKYAYFEEKLIKIKIILYVTERLQNVLKTFCNTFYKRTKNVITTFYNIRFKNVFFPTY